MQQFTCGPSSLLITWVVHMVELIGELAVAFGKGIITLLKAVDVFDERNILAYATGRWSSICDKENHFFRKSWQGDKWLDRLYAAGGNHMNIVKSYPMADAHTLPSKPNTLIAKPAPRDKQINQSNSGMSVGQRVIRVKKEEIIDFRALARLIPEVCEVSTDEEVKQQCQHLRIIRERHKYSRGDFATLLGVSKDELVAIENGYATREQIAALLTESETLFNDVSNVNFVLSDQG